MTVEFSNTIYLRLTRVSTKERVLPNRAKTFHDIGVIDRKIYVDLAQKAKVKGAIEGDENSKFFYDIVNKKRRRQILNEIVSWCKSRKEQALLFKVDFQKAFDSVRWDHLDDILGKFGFGSKWRGWIRGCLHSSKASVLVNGSPTNEFLFHRGLRQGNPLSPFLFILVMESLHVAFQQFIDRGMFVPILVGEYDLVPISHIFYANDAMFIGRWLNVIKAIHGSNGSLDQPPPTCTGCSIWITIHKAVANLKSKGVDLLGFCKKVIGNGNNSNFWYDKWLGDVCFKLRFNRRPRSGIEESQFQELSSLLYSVALSSSSDRWSWTLNGHGDFSVKSAREEIDKHLLITSSSSTRWSKLLPIKLNVFAWRMLLDKLPTRINLSNRGLNVPFVL
ncbi:RNA-directed DNA polymerase, eukaryota [Tanacetum coccineum]|uniref:RNA-directed DNA polymerase, eukaryota n=1 Tax=Tanacetum coccineum TaxID=301880 RepID=A0ABQ5GUN8_9ASTR